MATDRHLVSHQRGIAQRHRHPRRQDLRRLPARQRLYRVGLDGRDLQQLLVGAYGRLRTVAVAPDRSLWLLTTNRDGRMEAPGKDDDRLLRLTP